MADTHGMHHRDDPDTSREAAEGVAQSGKQVSHARLVLDLVRKYPGHTAVELLAIATEFHPEYLFTEEYEIRRRLTDLLQAGYIEQGRKRRCQVKGSTMVPWSAVANSPPDDELATRMRK